MDRPLIAIGAVPLAAGALVPVEAALDGPLLCPFQALTGAPCPFCGATRAFVLFGHGDGRWPDYGAVWVGVAIALVVLGLLGRRLGLRAALGAALLAWTWALLNAGPITS